MNKTKKYEYLDRKFAELRAERGNACQKCGHALRTLQGEFMHIKPTKLSGESRGRYERYMDIRDNPKKYLLACEACHAAQDLTDYEHRGSPYRLSAEEASRAVKHAMRIAGVGSTREMRTK